MSLSGHRAEVESAALVSVEAPLTSRASEESRVADRSHLLWSLKRLGVTRLIAPSAQLASLEAARRSLAPPPVEPQYVPGTLLALLRTFERQRAQRDLIGEIGWPQAISLRPPPSDPIALGDQQTQPVKLCFHDELIGSPRALLVHYGETTAELSGYHANISSISVPIGGELSAILVLKLSGELSRRIAHHALLNEERGALGVSSRQGPRGHQDELICVAHVSASGLLVDGPWWPNLLSSTHR